MTSKPTISIWAPQAKTVPVQKPEPEVTLDSANMGKKLMKTNVFSIASRDTLALTGQEAVIVKNGSRLCGTGSARSTAPIQQNKAYWEVKVQQSGIWSCGVRKSKNLRLGE